MPTPTASFSLCISVKFKMVNQSSQAERSEAPHEVSHIMISDTLVVINGADYHVMVTVSTVEE